MAILGTSGLGKDYGALSALHALDLGIEEGEIFGLLGPNGAGKTTAISMMCGVLTPTRGRVSVAGHDLAREPFEAKRHIGLVPQELALYEDLSATQNLEYFGALQRLRGAALKDAIAWVLGIAGLADRASEPVTRFSGGMKRRLNLAAGLLHRPAVLVCDEPTVGVDPQSRIHIYEALRALRREHGMTILYTSHYMQEVQELCSRIAVIDHGRLVAIDTIEGLLAAHGRGGVTLRVDGNADAVAGALGGLVRASRDADVFRFETPPSLAPVVGAVEAAGARITSLDVSQGDLEGVFLHLTGRHLRDES